MSDGWYRRSAPSSDDSPLRVKAAGVAGSPRPSRSARVHKGGWQGSKTPGGWITRDGSHDPVIAMPRFSRCLTAYSGRYIHTSTTRYPSATSKAPTHLPTVVCTYTVHDRP